MLVVIVRLSLGFSGQASYVLCVESNGHAQIERAGFDKQKGLPNCLDQTVDGQPITDDGELPCYDLPLDADNSGLQSSAPNLPEIFIDSDWMAASVLLFMLTLCSKPPVPALSPHPRLLDSRIIQRRCTVLLI